MKKYLIILCLSGLSFACIGWDYEKDIRNLVASNPNQLTFEEYLLIAQTVLKKAPCNLLVFGVGKDSKLWMNANKGGKTYFLEDNSYWTKIIQSRIPDIKIFPIRYKTQLKNWQRMLNNPNRIVLKVPLPKEIEDVKWDVIFVDGPIGHRPYSPGRMRSIYMASVLAKKNHHVDVFVHDCDRIVENIYSREFLRDRNLKQEIARLRHYHMP